MRENGGVGDRPMIYLDNNATTPLDAEVREAMLPFLDGHFANPSSGYGLARPVRRAVAQAREQVAELLDCEPEEIVFTSGGTESDNAAILSARLSAVPCRGVCANWGSGMAAG